jgi:hypothetical protein
VLTWVLMNFFNMNANRLISFTESNVRANNV